VIASMYSGSMLPHQMTSLEAHVRDEVPLPD